MDIVIVKHNAGNICSVDYALKRMGVSAIITSDKEQIAAADKIIFPGVGEAANTMRYLQKTGLDRLIPELKQPVLGICLGMQLMCRYSEEGDALCLGIFDTEVVQFHPQRHEDKVPHMGWNTIRNLQGPLFKGLSSSDFVYFVHSYQVPVNDFTSAVTDYIGPFSAALQKNNFYATQFHPEKSGKAGTEILRNFLEI